MRLAARVTLIERTVERLVSSRGERVSITLRLARERSRRGEVAPVLHDISVLTAEARQPGLRGQLARARLRLIEGVATEGLLPVPAWRQDARGADGSTETTLASTATRSVVPAPALARPSVSGALVDRIDQLLAVHGPV